MKHIMNEIVDELKSHYGIDVRDYKNSLQVTAVTTLVVDQTRSLTVELQHDTKEEASQEEGAIELPTYSNS
jgi:hypothetical protein